MWLLRGTVLGLGGDFGASRSGCHFTAITPPVAARWQGGPEEAAMQPGPLLSRAARHCSSVRCRRLSGTGARSSTDRASDYGSEGWGFESLRARHRLSRSQRRPLSGWIVVLVIWPYFGLTSLVGSVIEPVGVAVHVTWVEVPVQVEGRGDAGVPHDLLEHLRRVPGLDHQRGSGVPQVVNAEPAAEPGSIAGGQECSAPPVGQPH